jgi:hypothetical protein
MSKFSSFILSLGISSFLFLGQANAQPATLKELMELAGTHFSAIAKSVGDATKNQTSAEHASVIRVLFVDGFQFEPDVIKNAPDSEKRALLRLYQKLTAKMISTSAEAEDAFLANDNAKAKILVAEMAKIKQEGHTVFK